VDAYNLASMKTRVSIAAFDGAHLHGDLRMRLAREGEEFLGIGMETPVILKGVEVVCEDDEGLIAIYPYRDAYRTRVTTATTDTVFMTCGVPGILASALEQAAETTRDFVERVCR
jgi:DNA/RNA-binding domain of Phe-tRNA-synthetase-like protein